MIISKSNANKNLVDIDSLNENEYKILLDNF